jgi:hypothetical protein
MWRRLFITISWTAVLCVGQDSVVTGQYLEDRSSRVYGCPCEWSSDYASFGREAVVAWQIESGQYRGEKLAGLRLAAVLAGKFTLSDARSLRHSVLFVDSGTPDRQRQAGIAWLDSRFGDLLGRVLAVHAVPVTIAIDNDAALLRVSGVLEVRMRRADIDGDTQPWASLLYDPFTRLTSATLATTLHSEYSGVGLEIRWMREEPAITGYYGTFARP